MRTWRLSTHTNPKIVESVHSHLDRPKDLYIRGPNSVGKTGLAVGLLWHFAERDGVRGILVRERSFFPRLRRIYSDSANGDTEDGLALELERVPYLVWDDLAFEREPKNQAVRFLSRVVDTRYENRLPTIFTTNRPLDQVREIFGQDISDRIRAAFKIVRVDGPNLRLKDRDENETKGF